MNMTAGSHMEYSCMDVAAWICTMPVANTYLATARAADSTCHSSDVLVPGHANARSQKTLHSQPPPLDSQSRKPCQSPRTQKPKAGFLHSSNHHKGELVAQIATNGTYRLNVDC
jgi:hypothetical protein